MSRLHTQTVGRPKLTQQVTVTGTSATTASGVSNGVTIIRLKLTGASAVAYWAYGATAATSDTPISNGETEYVTVHPGESISVIGTDGTFHVTEITQ